MDIGSLTAFAGYHLQIKTGDCNVPKENWNRYDFPFWKYFEEAATAESLNNWEAKGKDISEWSDYAQKGAKHWRFTNNNSYAGKFAKENGGR